MTFTEAALQVLRSAGEPLHYKKIVELAIARNLLSHVGRTPEVTMSSRLATLVKKDRGQSGVVKVRPGVFAIRESSMQTDKEIPATGASDEAAQTAEATSTLPSAAVGLGFAAGLARSAPTVPRLGAAEVRRRCLRIPHARLASQA